MRMPWLVKTSSSYFHKARALRHTSSVLRYNARNPTSPVQARAIHGTLYERNRNTCSSSIVEFYKHLGIFRNTRECQKHSPSARTPPHFSSVLLKFTRMDMG